MQRVLPYVFQSPVIPERRSSGDEDVVPSPGPLWYPSVMGTGILANLLALHSQRIPGGLWAGVFVLVVAWLLLVGLTVAFVVRCVRCPRVFVDSWRVAREVPFWGTVSMGFLSVGSATAVVLPLCAPAWADFAWSVDTVTWIFGACVGVFSAVNFAVRSFALRLGAPNFVSGLAVVGPMVAATVGANLSPHLGVAGSVVLIVSFACFVMTLTLGVSVFIYAYVVTWGREPLPLGASASSWIPLGLVGQSAAAVQALSHNLEVFAQGSVVWGAHVLANGYGWTMFVIGVPLSLWAAFVTIRGVMARMPFSPGWWATTFPIGTMSLGATLMAGGTGQSWLLVLGACGTVVLVGTVCFSAQGTLRAVLRRRYR